MVVLKLEVPVNVDADPRVRAPETYRLVVVAFVVGEFPPTKLEVLEVFEVMVPP